MEKKRKWTKAQETAINATGNTLVSASAGTGKTAVLTEKVAKSAIEENIPIERMLVMTFSNAAATEMSDRIKAKFFDIMKDKEGTTPQQRKKAYVQIQKFPFAKIQTIHAFCHDIVKEFFYKIGIDANIEIATSFDTRLMKIETVNEILDEEYDFALPDFVALEEYVDGSETIEDVLINCYNKLISFVNPMEWLHDAVQKYNISETEIPDYIKDMLLDDFNKAIHHLDLAINELEAMHNDKMKKNLDVLRADRITLEVVVKAISAGDVNAINSCTFDDFAPTIRFPAKDDSFDNIKKNRSIAKDIVCDNYKSTGFSIKEQLHRIKTMYYVALKFEELMHKFDKCYTAKKTARKVIDFNDMEKYAYEILQDNGIASLISSRFSKIFVDEYQDTNPIQEAIINKIATSQNLFCVGDMKQSIYRFRASDPLLFLKRSNDYKNSTKKGSVISLSSNFRSTQNVLDCANDVFYHITEASNEIDYTTDDALIHGRNDDGVCNPVVIQTIPTAVQKMYTGITAEEIEVYSIVDTIKNVLGTTIYDQETNEQRAVQYGDIAILSRKLTGISDAFSQIFTANGIPYTIDKAGELLECVEVQVLLNVIDLINNPENDVKLISIVHEGFFGFDDENLIEIRTYNLKNTFFENMQALRSVECEVGYKCNEMLSFFALCKKKEQCMSLTDLIDYILSSLHFYDHFATMSNGDKRVSNIKLVCRYADEYEKKYSEKLLGFANYIKKIGNSSESIDDAKTNYDENSVRITTIHKSKGLEYPIVILGFMNKGFGTIDKRANIIIDKDAGIGFRYFDDIKREKGKTLVRTYVERITMAKNIEEEMRLLYVAMTRAKERLYIQGICDIVDQFSLEESKSMMDWILSTVLKGKFENDNTIRINGLWKLDIVEGTALLPYIDADTKPVSDKDFLNQFSGVGSKEIVEIVEKPLPVPTAVSSSRIGNMEYTEYDFAVPDFDDDSFSKSDIGTIVHLFMRNVDFKGDLTAGGLQKQLNNMVANNNMTVEEAKCVEVDKIAKFFETDYGKLIASADEYIRELPVSATKTASELGIVNTDDEILVRCIIDLVFVCDDKYYVADYKTDTIGEDDGNLSDKIKKHERQIGLYAEVFEKVYGKPVESTALVFFDIAEAIELNIA